MSEIDKYIQAATRDNTRRTYRAAIEHFENQWGGLLPATADSVARYLVDHAHSHAANTLKLRLAALAAWHNEQGFPDPTKAPLVKKVLKGIRELHPQAAKQAMPLPIEHLRTMVAYLDDAIATARQTGATPALLRHHRDKALLLIGFWRAFRGDELSRMDFSFTHARRGEGMEIYLPRSKADRHTQGKMFRLPALQSLCPVDAYVYWKDIAQLKEGPVFRPINRWGTAAKTALKPGSVSSLLRNIAENAGLGADGVLLTSHSLRRGFATWASGNGWGVKELMEHVGWKDSANAIRYIQSNSPFDKRLGSEPSVGVKNTSYIRR